MLESEEQLSATLHLELHTTRSEHFVGGTDIKFHVGDVELLLVVMLHLADFLLPVSVHHLSFGIVVIFVLRKQVWRSDIRVAYFRTDDIGSTLWLIFYGCGYIVRVLQVQ